MKQTRRINVVGMSTVPYYGPDALRGRVVVITGANNGIGKETMRQLASMGATVILLCRSVSRAKAAVQDVLSDDASKSSPVRADQFVIIGCDLGDLQSVRTAAGEVQRTVRGLPDGGPNNRGGVDVLINNAGVMMGRRSISRDGYELMMQANHLGHFLLTSLLMEQSPPPQRVINLTSCTYGMASPGFDFDDMFCSKKPYTLFGQYSQTKLANILHVQAMRRHHPDVRTYAVHPGIVRTNVTSNMQWYLRIPNDIFGVFVRTMQKTPTEGAYSTVFVAAAPESDLPPNGCYIVNCRPSPLLDFATSTKDAERLWQVSTELVRNNHNSNNNYNNNQTIPTPLEEKKEH
jgi:NAD(P)-dependent dehydrogenase (short-subunit alcohol dehydrogenase family)